MSAASIPADLAGGSARYLEVEGLAHERGDYLASDGQIVRAPSRWLSDHETLERLGIASAQSVDGEDFLALVEGRHPGTGEWVRRGGTGGRGGGICLTFSAPRSASVVWGLADSWQGDVIERAQARAVERSMDHLRREVPVVRRRLGGPVLEEPARDVLAVEYTHTVAWWVTGAPTPDPHLHSHVVVTGAVREDERIVAVASRPVFRAARELGAFYRSALAEELAGEGYGIERSTGKDGRYFEVLGVPRELCEALSGHSREIARAAERFRARFGRAPRQGELRDPALENDHTRTPGAPSDPREVWRATAHRCEFGAEQTVRLIALSEPQAGEHPAVDRIEAKLTERRAIFDPKDLRAVALEQTAGELGPARALGLAGEMVRDRRVLMLEGGRMTTRAVRRQERGIERRAGRLGRPAGRDVGSPARESAARKVMERIASPLNPEQQRALVVLTGAERAAVLVGPAGTGKGIVIDAAMRAEQLAGRETFGVAVSWSTAERLGADSPALQGRTMALDSLIARAKAGDVDIGPDTTIVFDEAGMTDHARLDALTRLVERSGAKLVAVGDGKQLPSIGPGGMFDRLTSHVPTAELQAIHRTKDPAEQAAWHALRAGEPERALAHYASRGALHLADTRDEAAENAVQAWARLDSENHDIRDIALIADASNQEIDRLNARAQHLRAQRGELGRREVPLPHMHYGIRRGDLIAFTRQHRPPGESRVENGSRGEITALDPSGGVTIALDGSDRRVQLAARDLKSLRLAYAQHVYRQQGATVERAVVLTGSWQTSKETAYVEATRARQRTDWHIAREDLGPHGPDSERIARLAQRMGRSRAHIPSNTHREAPGPDWQPTRDPLHLGDHLPGVPLAAEIPGRDALDRDTDRGR